MQLKQVTLSATVAQDDITKEVAQAFDYTFTGTTVFKSPSATVPDAFSIGLIVGPSGSGKSTLLSQFGTPEKINWNPAKAVCSYFNSATEARQRLGAVGLNSIPAWVKPYHVLSTGEAFRADLAARLVSGAVVDEFTSVVDRAVAKSCAFSAQRYIRSNALSSVVFASCHYDIIPWLSPDWVLDTATGIVSLRGAERRPEIKLEVLPTSPAAWPLFCQHHYLSLDLNKSSRCWLVAWEDTLVGFSSVIALPSGTLKNAWRGHRTVVLPEFQGLGIGTRISDCMGEFILAEGGRYFSKTASHRMGEYRNASSLWKPTSKNQRARADYLIPRKSKESGHVLAHATRNCYSHEYIGPIG